ncbi:cutinase family protein [Nocardia sp. CA2R105]|uniref:cutinase family protein n=1 Tax=Nocardia coffeae TaxID=2873381 RepID=UPI001CA73074|nr:cutinase family protein [Nocardia coffeae]MBY8858599.1 cutinase family protein [Nocardia coffeae]
MPRKANTHQSKDGVEHRPGRRSTVICALLTTMLLAGLSGTAVAQPASPTVPLGETCPALYVLGVQGADQTSPDAAATTDTGALGQFFTPLESAAGHDIQHAYVPYGYSADGTTQQPFDQAVTTAAAQLGTQAREVLNRCPHTRIGVVGDRQGAAAVAAFAQRIGVGSGAIPADAVAAVALFANPGRPAGTPIFPGRPGQATPDPAPGTSGSRTHTVTLTSQQINGAGIAQSSRSAPAYGALTGRVADLCVPGDLACDTPAQSPIAQTIQNITTQSNLHDPLSAVTTVAQALAGTVWKTAIGVAGQDIQGDSLDQLSYQPTKSLGQRLAEASNPNTPPPGPDQILSALFRLGTIGLNTVVTVAQKVLTPATIAELAAVGMTNPGAAIADLGVKVAGAVAELVPPTTALGWVDQAFGAITSTVSNNDLYGVATQAQYSDSTSHGEAYTVDPATPQGTPVFAAAADWFAALAHDIAATNEPSSSPTAEPTNTTPPAADTETTDSPPATSTGPVTTARPSPAAASP